MAVLFLLAMFVALAGEVVDAAQEGAAHAASDTVIVRGIGEADLGGAGACHGIRIAILGGWVPVFMGVLVFAPSSPRPIHPRPHLKDQAPPGL